MVTYRCPQEEVGCIPPVVSEMTFSTFLLVPRHECGGTTPNMPGAAIHNAAGQASTFILVILREDYTIGAASYFDTNVLLWLNFVTMMDLCFNLCFKISSEIHY